MNAIQALSQLGYGPAAGSASGRAADAPPKSRRASAGASAAKATPKAVVAATKSPEDAIEDGVTTANGDRDVPGAEIVDATLEADGGQQDIIEDVTELGEDENDMAEVIDGIKGDDA